jgi:hypothetical protein
MSQFAVVKDCQIPFRFGLPSSVRAISGPSACPGVDMAKNPSAAMMTITPATIEPFNPIAIGCLYFPAP